MQFTDHASIETWFNHFVLEEELPLASMADPGTLSDFIAWSAEKYPARKYALVLWDHGGGSRTGILIDELFDGDMLYLDELKQALAQGGVSFEAVLFDACLMANLETASAIKDNARWMIVSQELVAGKGTAVQDWLQQLMNRPEADGKRLGRWICDMTQSKYASEANEQAQLTMTWSVTDLSKIDRLESLFDQVMEALGTIYQEDPLVMQMALWNVYQAPSFGLYQDSVIDLGFPFYKPSTDSELMSDLSARILDALEDAMVYQVRGSGRGEARGLSICSAMDFSSDALNIYARNCTSAHYLALLDAIYPDWTAPDWVYDQAERLPDIRSLASYQMEIQKTISEDGIPGIAYPVTDMGYVNTVYASLYQYQEESDRTIQLGWVSILPDYNAGNEMIQYSMDSFGIWPAVEGVLCDVELVSTGNFGSSLYNIPVRASGRKPI